MIIQIGSNVSISVTVRKDPSRYVSAWLPRSLFYKNVVALNVQFNICTLYIVYNIILKAINVLRRKKTSPLHNLPVIHKSACWRTPLELFPTVAALYSLAFGVLLSMVMRLHDPKREHINKGLFHIDQHSVKHVPYIFLHVKYLKCWAPTVTFLSCKYKDS